MPVTILSGFLGAGKTTLLRHLLQSEHGLRLGVVVNDFGAINIDAALIREVQGATQTLRLTNGCICCSIRGDLLETVVQLSAQPEPPDWIVIEASGVSDPHEIAATFSLAELGPITRLDAIVALVDAEQFPQLSNAARSLAHAQVEAADLILLNKADLVTEEQLAHLGTEVGRIAAGARVLPCVHGAVPVDVVLGAHTLPPAARRTAGPTLHSHAAHPDHTAQFDTFDWQCDEPLDAQRLRDALAALPSSILRGKGYARVVQAPHEEAILQLVGRRASLTRAGPWRGPPRTCLVFVGTAEPGARERAIRLLERARAR